MTPQAKQTIELVASIAGLITLIWTPLGAVWKLPNHTRLSRLIFSGGYLASIAVLAAVAIALLPLLPIGADSVVIGNDVAVVALGLALLSWLAALYVAFRNKHWVVGGALLLVGLPLYSAATFFNDFLSYLAVGMLPMLFGLFASQR